jgi:hypothetical protein
MFIAAFAASAFAQPHNVLEVSGTCPDVTFTGSAFHPHSPVVVLHSADVGDARLQGGPCKGLETGLADLSWTRFARIPATGAFEMDLTLPEPACEEVYQVLDLRTCTLSNVVAIEPPIVDPAPGDLGGDDTGTDTGL